MTTPDAILGLDIFSKKTMNLKRSVEINGIKVNYELQCKSWWTSQYIYLLRAFLPNEETLTFYVLSPIFSAVHFCVHLKGNLMTVARKYSFLPERIAKRYPALNEILCTHSPSYLDGSDLKMEIPRCTIGEHNVVLKGAISQALEKFLPLLIQALREAEDLINSPIYTEESIDEKQILKLPFICHRDLNLPLSAKADNLELKYARIWHNKDTQHKDFFVCQIKVGNKFLTFFVKQRNMIDPVCRIVANKSSSLRIIHDIIPLEDIDALEKQYPGMCTVIFSYSSKQFIGDNDRLIMKTGSYTYMPGKDIVIPQDVLKLIPEFVKKLILAEHEVRLFKATSYYIKHRKQFLKKKKNENDAASVGGMLLLARLALRLANIDFDLGGADNLDIPDADTNPSSNIGLDFDVTPDTDISNGHPEINTDNSTIFACDFPNNESMNQMTSMSHSDKHYMFSNPFDIGMDPQEMYSMGMIDSNTYDSMCSIENFFEERRAASNTRHQELMDLIGDNHDSSDDISVQQIQQTKFDAADADQKEALRLREEAFDNGDTAEFERQTAKVRDLQYAKETYKDSPIYVPDVDVRAGLKKP